MDASKPLQYPRHEVFAQALARGVPYDKAYVHAGYKHDQSNASRLTRNDLVCARTTWLKAQATIRHHFTVDDLIRLSEEARVKALELGQMGAAVAAIRELGILTGHRIERRDMRVHHEHELSDAELLQIARQALQPKPLELKANRAGDRGNGHDESDE